MEHDERREDGQFRESFRDRRRRGESNGEGVSRRGFLRGAAVAVISGVSLKRPLCSMLSGAEDRWKMRLSTSSVHFGSLSVEEACRHISTLGFEGVDFWPSPFGCRHLDEIENRLGPEGLKALLSEHNLTLYAFSCYSVGYPKYAEILGKAGGGVAVRGSRGGKAVNLSQEMKVLMEALKPEIELAERFDSTLAIENHGDALLDSLDSFKAFVEMNPNPKRLGIALAPYHLQAAKIPVPEAIAVAGRQLFFFYAWQHAEGLKQLPGIGPTDCSPWIAALAKAGYHGYVNPFMHGDLETDMMVKSLSTSRDYLKECYAKAIPA